MNITIKLDDLLEILWMARRYANDRKTYAPQMFNDAYNNMVKDNPVIKEKEKKDVMVPQFPYAKQGKY